MTILAQADVGGALQQTLSSIAAFIPQLLGFLLILVIGYFIAKIIAKVIAKVLERVGFDKAVEKGGVKKAMEKSKYDPSDILGKLVFYTIMLFVLQLAFGVFPQNPISDLIYQVIGYLPRIFAAILIVVVTAAIAAAVKEIVEASLGGLSYGRALAFAASTAILVVGGFAALGQLQIAPDIINGLFYALLAVVAGSAIVAIGGGGIQPMRAQWEKAMNRVEQEAPQVRQEAQGSKEKVKARAEERRDQARSAADSSSDSEDGRPSGGATRSDRTINLPEEERSQR